MLRHQANHGFTPIIGPSQNLLPLHASRGAGVRVKVDDDLADQPVSVRSGQVFNASASILSRLE